MTTHQFSPTLMVVLFDSMKDMPADRYAAAQQFETMAAELAGTEADCIVKLSRVEAYGLNGNKELFREELHNYRLARQLSCSAYQPGQIEWACYVHSVNDQPNTDYSEDALIGRIKEWSALGLTQRMIEDTLSDVKKNGKLN